LEAKWTALGLRNHNFFYHVDNPFKNSVKILVISFHFIHLFKENTFFSCQSLMETQSRSSSFNNCHFNSADKQVRKSGSHLRRVSIPANENMCRPSVNPESGCGFEHKSLEGCFFLSRLCSLSRYACTGQYHRLSWSLFFERRRQSSEKDKLSTLFAGAVFFSPRKWRGRGLNSRHVYSLNPDYSVSAAGINCSSRPPHSSSNF